MEPNSSFKIEQQLKQIRQQVWRLRDGSIASSLREKEVNYAYNLGVPIPQLRLLANQFKKNELLATTLLAQHTRELLLLGYMMFPIDAVTPNNILALLTTASTPELQDNFAFHIVSEVTSFDAITYILLNAPVENNNALSIVLTAATKRLHLGRSLTKNAIDILFAHIQNELLHPSVINFIHSAEEKTELKPYLLELITNWKNQQNSLIKKQFAEEIAVDLG